MDGDFDFQFGEDQYGSSGIGRFILGAGVLLGVLALGGLIGKMTSGPSAAQATPTPPVVSMQQQMQQAAIEALHTQQQMMIDMRKKMAEAEGFYEDGPVGEDGDYLDDSH